jgi:small-conductance mechanosensitive channel
MHRPWEKHLSTAIVLAAAAFAVAQLWNAMAGAAIGAVAFFVALRPLFRNRRTRK